MTFRKKATKCTTYETGVRMGSTNPNCSSSWLNIFMASFIIILSSPLSNPFIDFHKTSMSNAHLSEKSSVFSWIFLIIKFLGRHKKLLFSQFGFYRYIRLFSFKHSHLLINFFLIYENKPKLVFELT